MVEATQNGVTAIQLEYFRTQSIEDTGKFTGDKPTPHNRYPLRQFRQVKSFVRSDDMLDTRNVRHPRAATGGDQDSFRADGLHPPPASGADQ